MITVLGLMFTSSAFAVSESAVLFLLISPGARAAGMGEAFVAVADEIGLPEDIGSYPRLSVWISLAQRRWRANSEAIRSQIVRAGLGGAIAMALVAVIQLLPATVLNPDFFDATVELMPIAMTMIAGALLGLFWGGLQGIAIGLHMGLTDVMWTGRQHPKWRLFFAGMAGLTSSIIYILLSLSGGFSPEAGPERNPADQARDEIELGNVR